MINLHPIRQRAWEAHCRLRPELSEGAMALMPAEELLDRASDETGLMRFALPPDDGLLAGARAVLLRDHDCVYYAEPDSPQTARLQRFSQAHEFAHNWLHKTVVDAFEVEEDADDTQLEPAAACPPCRRRRRWPRDTVRPNGESRKRMRSPRSFCCLRHSCATPLRSRGAPQSEISDLVGVSEVCVLTQLALALLLPASIADSGCHHHVRNRSTPECKGSRPCARRR